ncbi:hypothetical protein KGP36_02240 [Patescibacteria group bacterium]|nr:hypothetical protein [Patescibacteria group bacterium]
MKDSFIFEGKKYISARRASEISDYAADYIGQLCRAQKLDCRMIGRSWFVTEESIRSHQVEVLRNEVHRNRIENLRGGKNAKPVEADETQVAAPVSSGAFEAAADQATPVSVEQDVLPEPAVPSEPVVNAEPVIADITPAIPELPVHVELPRRTYVELEEQAEMLPASRSRVEARQRRSPVLAAVAIVIIGGAVAFYAMTGMSGSELASNGSASQASVGSAFASVASFFSRGFDEVLALLGHTPTLATNISPTPIPSMYEGSASDQSQGIAVAPSTGLAQGDAQLKQEIQASFSDQVNVTPDKSGTTGVITPVFRDSTGKQFVYVMVPVKPADSGAAGGGKGPP